MIKTIVITIICLIIISMAGCREIRQVNEDGFITVDVTKNYLQKKDLIIQDFMEVEYVILETKEGFLTQGVVEDVGNELILVRNNNRINDGNVFIFDRKGKALRIINRKGQGSDEYIRIHRIILDEINGEMYVNDIVLSKIIVYDLYGNFKRSFRTNEENEKIWSYYTDIFNYDNDNLICYDILKEEKSFFLISKKDGSITKEIKIPYKKAKFLRQISGDNRVYPAPSPRPITPYSDNWILLEFSSDTVYTFLPDFTLHPFIIRKPSVNAMNPEVMLLLRFMSDRYYFIETIKNEYNFITESGFPRTSFLYDKQEKKFFGYRIYNGDYSNRIELNLGNFKALNQEIESWYRIDAFELIESYENNELKDGTLKEIASNLDAEDNPVIMLVKHKK